MSDTTVETEHRSTPPKKGASALQVIAAVAGAIALGLLTVTALSSRSTRSGTEPSTTVPQTAAPTAPEGTPQSTSITTGPTQGPGILQIADTASLPSPATFGSTTLVADRLLLSGETICNYDTEPACIRRPFLAAYVGSTLDASFGNNGWIFLPPLGGFEPCCVHTVVADSTDPTRFLVVGSIRTDRETFTYVARFLADGTLDRTFGASTGFTSILTSDEDATYYPDPEEVTIDPSGRVIVAGELSNGDQAVIAVIRFTPDGTLDFSFGRGGITDAFPFDGNEGSRDFMMIATDDGITVAAEDQFYLEGTDPVSIIAIDEVGQVQAVKQINAFEYTDLLELESFEGRIILFLWTSEIHPIQLQAWDVSESSQATPRLEWSTGIQTEEDAGTELLTSTFLDGSAIVVYTDGRDDVGFSAVYLDPATGQEVSRASFTDFLPSEAVFFNSTGLWAIDRAGRLSVAQSR